jgi:hypothetical protein
MIDELSLKRQKSFLEKFLNDCFKNPMIRDSKIFADFLSVSDEVHYQVKKKVIVPQIASLFLFTKI